MSPVNNNPVLERNLLALASRNPDLSIRTGRAEASGQVQFSNSRTGKPVPRVSHNGRHIALHSLFDPEKEGRRFAEACVGGGYIVLLGLGAAYHVLPFLERSDITGILVVDKDIELFKSILSVYDLRGLILDPRVHILIDTSPEDISAYILSSYLPAITGDIQTLFLRSRMETEEGYFKTVLDEIKVVLGKLADDYTVQTYFGKKWFINTLANLDTAQNSTVTVHPIKKALITGAGPSLEVQLPRLLELRAGGTLIATDTSLPYLLDVGVTPDLVISIDCQQVTYHHFLQGFPEDIPLVLDLASPSGITREARRTVFFSSGHPFSQYVSSNWRHFPNIDISGGNVSHAAVSLADTLGAEEIHLFGTDFSFPNGKSYARGTYIYPYFMERDVRTGPLESRFFAFLMRNRNIVREYADYGIRYTTKPMISYKKRLEDAASELSARLVPEPGLGVPLQIHGKGTRKTENRISRFFSAGSAECGWREFLKTYRKGLAALPRPEDPLAAYFESLTPAERDLWTTLFPAAAVFRRNLGRDSVPGAAVLSDVRSWSLDILRRYV